MKNTRVLYSFPNGGIKRITVTEITLFLKNGIADGEDTKCFTTLQANIFARNK